MKAYSRKKKEYYRLGHTGTYKERDNEAESEVDRGRKGKRALPKVLKL